MTTMHSQEILVYFRRLRPYLAASTLLFAAGFVGAWVAVHQFPEVTAIFEKSLAGFIKKFGGLPKLQLAAAIFFNNALKTLAAILLGVFAGLLPAFFLLLNGAAMGLIFNLSGRGIGPTLLAIAPHGILELPAVFMASGAGLMVGAAVIQKLFTRRDVEVKTELARALRFFAAVILPTLFIAALVEAYVTTALLAR
jgi:stage II sporulation protein M